MPVGGVHVDLMDRSAWASTDAGEKHRPELPHFDEQGKLLERHASPGKMPYDLNDLVLRGSREIFTTDTEGHHVYRFDRASHRGFPLLSSGVWPNCSRNFLEDFFLRLRISSDR
jgi:hypothetical protein